MEPHGIFMLWGLYYGLLLLLEKYFLAPKLEKLPGIVQQIYSFVLVLIGWVLFFSTSLSGAISYLGNMFGIGGNGFIDSTGLYYLAGNFILLIICFFCATPVVWKKFRKIVLQKKNAFSCNGCCGLCGDPYFFHCLPGQCNL